MNALAGGIVIGLSAAALLLLLGRVAGISGIFAGMLRGGAGERAWRASFVLGLLAGGALLHLVAPGAVVFDIERSLPTVVGAGLLVGYGTRLGNGCTSGHGVCGIGRGSPRSFVATVTFIATGILTVLLTSHVRGTP